MTPTVADALAGARYLVPGKARQKTVLVVGAAGRLGERVLVRMLGAPGYHKIYVLAANDMPSTEAKLCPITLSSWTTQIDDVIAVVSESTEPSVGLPRKRTEIFSSLSADTVLSLAQQAKALGARRFILVTPTDVLAQPAAIYAQLSNLMEARLHHIGFESLVLVRPSDFEVRNRQSGFVKRFWSILSNTAAGLMVGLKHTPLSLEDTARAIVYLLNDDAPGLRIIEIDHLHNVLRS